MAVAISNDFLTPLEIISCLQTEVSANALQDSLAIKNLLLCASGSDALLRIFNTLKKFSTKPLIAMAAYSCPHVAVAAGIAGFKILPLDTSATSFDPELPDQALLEQCAAVVLSNLFGIPDTLTRWQEAIDQETLLIDDACQSYLSFRNTVRVGTAPNTLGVMSFGRGKPLAGIGGGAIIAEHITQDSDTLAAKIWRDLQSKSDASQKRRVLNKICCAAGYWFATLPQVFKLILMSSLDLGKPDCPTKIISAQISNFELAYILKQASKHTALTSQLHLHAQQWNAALADVALEQPWAQHSANTKVIPIRYPLICPSAALCQRAVRRLHSIGIGTTTGYRQLIQDWRSVAVLCQKHSTPVARHICDRVLLLPNHSKLTQRDIDLSAAALRDL